MTTILTAAAESARLTPVFDADRLTDELDAVTAHTWNPQRPTPPAGRSAGPP
ncbi:hypothetical protein AB0D27_43310 [Streptomyces sp. NPDC048415]|uniref:hypothetical protein n=1 Tax=Streptomyces sp. NPDC048415 TaxID=3154822 RepID=UPI00343F6AC0